MKVGKTHCLRLSRSDHTLWICSVILSGLNVSVGASKESDSAVSKYVSILGFLTSTMRSSVEEINSSKVCCSALTDSSTISTWYCEESISISGSKPNKSRILILLDVLVLFIEK